jgi:hypothetical protein
MSNHPELGSSYQLARIGETTSITSIGVLAADVVYGIARYGDAYIFEILREPASLAVGAVSMVGIGVGEMLRRRYINQRLGAEPNLNPGDIQVPSLFPRPLRRALHRYTPSVLRRD